MGALITEADLADQLGVGESKVAELRRRHGWAHVRVSRFDIRYTQPQAEQVIAILTVAPKRQAENATGLTSRSARRAS